MNYFERLVRRALLRPADAPGAPLRDPFEEIAEWPLDAPRPRTQTPVLAEPTPAAATVVARETADAMPRVLNADEVVRESTPIAVASTTPVASPLTAPIAVPVDARAIESRLQPGEAAPAPREVAAPLELADGFMRSLGVRMPDEVTAPEPRTIEAREPKMPDVVPPQAPSRPRPLHVMPPAPAQVIVPAIPAAFKAREPAPPAPERRVDDERPAQPERARPPVETHRVIVVERPSGAGGASRVTSGGGAPHFGLGQL